MQRPKYHEPVRGRRRVLFPTSSRHQQKSRKTTISSYETGVDVKQKNQGKMTIALLDSSVSIVIGFTEDVKNHKRAYGHVL